MKKKWILTAGILALCLTFGGCGNKDKDTNPKVEQGPEEKKEDNMVSMEKDTDKIDKSRIAKSLGTKTANAGEVVITNETGREISEFHMRPTPAKTKTEDEDYEDSSWGADLTQEKFTLKNKEQALLYYDKENKDSSGVAVKNYDLQVAFKDMDVSENCYFRNLDLTVTEEITLYLEEGIPYVKYRNRATKQEVSTLAEVKKRLGITDSENSSHTDPTPAATETPEATETPAVTTTPDPTTAPPEPAVDPKQKAEGYIGSSADGLFADSDIGNPEGYDDDEDPETGAIVRFYYYDGFTVYVVVNDDGSETVQDVY